MKNTTLFSLIVAMLVPLFPFVGASGYDFSEDFSFVIEDTPQGKFITGWKYDRTEESLSDEEILQIASTVTSLTVPSNVSCVEEDVLASFEGVKDLTIEDSDTPLIGYGGLFKKLEKIYLGRDCTHWNFCGWWSSLEESRQTLKTLIVGDKVTELTSDMFEDNVLEEVSLGKGLKKSVFLLFAIVKSSDQSPSRRILR